MIRYFLASVEIEGFRGINNQGDPLRVTFDRNGVNSVFATNAQGKSSIYDALSYAIRGEVPKLERLPAAERAGDYYVNRFHSGGESVITLGLAPEDGGDLVSIVVRRQRDGTRSVESPSGFESPEALLRALDDDICLVDHRQFQSFIDDSALARGRAFSSLLGMRRLSEFRQALETLSHRRGLDTDFELSTLIRKCEQGRSEARRLDAAICESAARVNGTTPETPVDLDTVESDATAALRAEEVLAEHVSDVGLSDINFEALRSAVRAEEDSDGQAQLAAALATCATLQGLAPAEGEDSELVSLRSIAEERQASLDQTSGALHRALFLAVRAVLASDEWDRPADCPACESSLAAPLDETLGEKLAQFEDVERASAALREQWRTATASTRLRRLLACPLLDEVKGVDGGRVHAIATRTEQGQTSAEEVEEITAALATLEAGRGAVLQRQLEVVEKLKASLPESLVKVTELIANAEALCAELTATRKNATSLSSDEARLTAFQAWATFVSAAKDSFAEAEIELSTAVTTALRDTYQSMYAEITGNPEIVPKLRKSTGSEELRLVLDTFYGLRNVSAPTLLSESYRNAFAISLFLSIALESGSAARFVVFDDVTSSFDAGHQLRLMELIRHRVARPRNEAGIQVILLSHDGVLEKYFDRISEFGGWRHQKLIGTPPNGDVQLRGVSADRFRVRAEEMLASGEPDAAKPHVRQHLELRLMKILGALKIPVPIDFALRSDRQQIQTALNAIRDAVRLRQSAGGVVLTASDADVLTDATLPALIGNVLAHYSTGSETSFTPAVIRSFLDDIDRLTEHFQYECRCSGNARLRFFRDLTRKACEC